MNYLLKPNIQRFNSYIRYLSNKTGTPRPYLKYKIFYDVPYDEQYEQHDFKKGNKSYNFTKSNEYRFKYNRNDDLMIDKHYLDYDNSR